MNLEPLTPVNHRVRTRQGSGEGVARRTVVQKGVFGESVFFAAPLSGRDDFVHHRRWRENCHGHFDPLSSASGV